MIDITANCVGAAAYRALSSDRMATVIGVTSRGLFVRVDDACVIFVSFEQYRGPLTITLHAGSLRAWPAKQALEPGAAAHISKARLTFPAIEVAISVSPDAVWRYPDPVMPARSTDEQLRTIRLIAREVLTRKSDAGLGAWLEPLLELPGESNPQRDRLAPVDLVSLRQALAGGDFTRALDLINRLLGFGRGLTPSGDDCVIGLLLMLNRWPRFPRMNSRADNGNTLKRVSTRFREAYQPSNSFDGDLGGDLNRRIIDAAYQRTTTISANLIECAADGQGDERLMKVVDGIVMGEPSIDECVDCVLDWGSSSGIDALVGMALAITI